MGNGHKQWYDWFQSLKCKEITFNSLSTNSSTSNPPIDGDPLFLLMTRCPHVKHVILPQGMDSSQSEDDWAYFSSTLVSADVWKLHSLSIRKLPQIINGVVAKRHYYECLYHLRDSLKKFMLTTSILSGGYGQLQDFQQLISLIIADDLIGILADLCKMMDYLPHLTKVAVYFTTYMRDDSFNNNNTAIMQEQQDLIQQLLQQLKQQIVWQGTPKSAAWH